MNSNTNSSLVEIVRCMFVTLNQYVNPPTKLKSHLDRKLSIIDFFFLPYNQNLIYNMFKGTINK